MFPAESPILAGPPPALDLVNCGYHFPCVSGIEDFFVPGKVHCEGELEINMKIITPFGPLNLPRVLLRHCVWQEEHEVGGHTGDSVFLYAHLQTCLGSLRSCENAGGPFSLQKQQNVAPAPMLVPQMVDHCVKMRDPVLQMFMHVRDVRFSFLRKADSEKSMLHTSPCWVDPLGCLISCSLSTKILCLVPERCPQRG